MSSFRVVRLFVSALLAIAAMGLWPEQASAAEATGVTDSITAITAQAWPQVLLGIYCGLIVIGSFAGGWLPTKVKLTHNRMQLVISFVGGLMLGIGLFHLLPHAIAESGSVDASCRWMMFGILTMFLLIRVFHVHHHGPFELPDEAGTVVADSYQHKLAEEDAGHDHDCGHEQHRGHGHAHQPHRLSWFGIALGLGLHTLIDGIALGASVQADAGHDVLFNLLGLGTFLAVFLHKPLDAVSITSLMGAAGWSTKWQHAVNIVFAMLVPIGAGLFFVGLHQLDDGQRQIVGAALAFSAGVFICISLGDLLPEMEFHRHSRIPLTLSLITGILLAWAITFLEPAHQHDDPAQGLATVGWQPTDEASRIAR